MMNMKNKVEYSREQAIEMYSDYIDSAYMSISSFIDAKFPPKIDFVGKVWKSETNKFIAYFEQIKNGNYVGYGVNFRGNWFKGIACNNDLDELSNLVEATDTEWQAALIKEAERRGFVKGVEFLGVQGFRSDTPIEIGKECDIKFNRRGIFCDNSYILFDGKWAKPELRPSPSVHSVREAISFIELHKKQFFAPTEIEVNGVKYKKQQ